MSESALKSNPTSERAWRPRARHGFLCAGLAVAVAGFAIAGWDVMPWEGHGLAVLGLGLLLIGTVSLCYGLMRRNQKRPSMDTARAETGREALRHQFVGRLAGEIAHELSNPLCSVLGNLEYLTAALDPTEGPQSMHGAAAPNPNPESEVTAAARDALEAALQMRDRMIALATVAGRSPAPSTKVSLNSALEKALALTHFAYKRKARLSLHTRTIPDVLGCEAELCHALAELIVAITSTFGDDAQTVIEATTQNGGPEVALILRFSGCCARDAAALRDALVLSPRILADHQGRLEIGPLANGEGCVRICLPVAGSAAASATGTT